MSRDYTQREKEKESKTYTLFQARLEEFFVLRRLVPIKSFDYPTYIMKHLFERHKQARNVFCVI